MPNTAHPLRLAGHRFVYGLGRIVPSFPRPALEAEFAQLVAENGLEDAEDSEALHAILSRRDNRYLARQLCWLFLIGGIETFLLRPRDPVEFTRLVEAVRAVPSASDVDLVIGRLETFGWTSEASGGLGLPVVGFDQIYSFDVASLVEALPALDGAGEGASEIAAELFVKIMNLAENAGVTDEHRAVNYLAVRCEAIYRWALEGGLRAGTVSIDMRPSVLGSERSLVDVVFTAFGSTQPEPVSLLVDVSDEFPFLVSDIRRDVERATASAGGSEVAK